MTSYVAQPVWATLERSRDLKQVCSGGATVSEYKMRLQRICEKVREKEAKGMEKEREEGEKGKGREGERAKSATKEDSSMNDAPAI